MAESSGEELPQRIRGQTAAALRRLLDYARIYSRDPDAAQRAAEFLLFKLWAAAYAREDIIRTIQGGVTSMRYMPESLEPGSHIGPISVETEDRQALDRLHLFLDAYLLELVGVADALAQLANATFDLGLPIDDPRLLQKVDSKLRDGLTALGIERPTGLEGWRTRATPWLDDLWELRNQTTHRHLVRLVEQKAWEQQRPTPGPGKWTSDFVVDIRPGDSRPLIDFVALSYDDVLKLLRSSLELLRSVLKLVQYYRGGPKAAARRQAWHSTGGGACSHAVVEPSDSLDREPDEHGVPRSIYFCSTCGERVDDFKGRGSPDGGVWFA